MEENTESNPSTPENPEHQDRSRSYSFSYSAPVLNNTVGVVILGVINIILIFLLARSNHQYKELVQKTLK